MRFIIEITIVILLVATIATIVDKIQENKINK